MSLIAHRLMALGLPRLGLRTAVGGLKSTYGLSGFLLPETDTAGIRARLIDAADERLTTDRRWWFRPPVSRQMMSQPDSSGCP